MRKNLIIIFVSAAFLLSIFSGCSAAKKSIDRESAWQIVQEKVLEGRLENIIVYCSKEPVPAGTELKGWTKSYTVPEEFQSAWVFFIDDAPEANWEHSCRYIFVDQESGGFKVTEGRTPPDNLGDMDKLYPEDK